MQSAHAYNYNHSIYIRTSYYYIFSHKFSLSGGLEITIIITQYTYKLLLHLLSQIQSSGGLEILPLLVRQMLGGKLSLRWSITLGNIVIIIMVKVTSVSSFICKFNQKFIQHIMSMQRILLIQCLLRSYQDYIYTFTCTYGVV